METIVGISLPSRTKRNDINSNYCNWTISMASFIIIGRMYNILSGLTPFQKGARCIMLRHQVRERKNEQKIYIYKALNLIYRARKHLARKNNSQLIPL
jgi:hypothetical protein